MRRNRQGCVGNINTSRILQTPFLDRVFLSAPIYSLNWISTQKVRTRIRAQDPQEHLQVRNGFRDNQPKLRVSYTFSAVSFSMLWCGSLNLGRRNSFVSFFVCAHDQAGYGRLRRVAPLWVVPQISPCIFLSECHHRIMLCSLSR